MQRAAAASLLYRHLKQPRAPAWLVSAQRSPSRRFLSAPAQPERVAVITGSSSGIGESTARLLASSGWQVHNVSRSACPVAGVTNHAFDLASPDGASLAAASLLSALMDGSVGGAGEVASAGGGEGKYVMAVVHNAAMHGSDSATAFDAAAMTAALHLSVVAPGVLTSALLPLMRKGSLDANTVQQA
ncbi:hypothetical protein T484DRAFT_1856623 [Baffinella frigidus]|nr:hypothetical protein T484DRAFT_1856623 [Cryptophyta sp. CCMP2293]